ncbi:MAG TPA: PIN domain-containing protein [Opitutaceae bacterium]
MIVLDANYLIGAPKPGSTELSDIARWHQAGETLSTTAIAWTEFLSGPVTAEDVADVRALLAGGVLDFDEACAETAARLFNLTGRNRRLRVDGMIAAITMMNHGRLATRNLHDFQLFVPQGLKLA